MPYLISHVQLISTVNHYSEAHARCANILPDIQPGLLSPCIQTDQGLNQPVHHIETSGDIILWGQKRTSRHYLGSGLFVFLAINTLTGYRLCCPTQSLPLNIPLSSIIVRYTASSTLGCFGPYHYLNHGFLRSRQVGAATGRNQILDDQTTITRGIGAGNERLGHKNLNRP